MSIGISSLRITGIEKLKETFSMRSNMLEYSANTERGGESVLNKIYYYLNQLE